jgi:glycosyltransferase involved in cell wall biosynthesis
MPRISVVIPTYNMAHFIGESIQSVLDQTFPDFELVVVDDGSMDNTSEVIRKFQDPRITYILQENSGPAAARNAGIRASSGEYIAFLDSDDILLETTFEKQIPVLDTHLEVGFVFGQRYYIDENSKLLGLYKPRHKLLSYVRSGIEEVKELLIRGNVVPPSMSLVRRSCLEEAGLFDPSFRHGSEDFELWMRLSKKYAVAYIAEPLGKYRIHSSNISIGRDLDEIEKSNSRIFQAVFDDVNLGPSLAYLRPRTYSLLDIRLASYAFDKREMRKARGYLLRALKMHPPAVFHGEWLHWFVRTLIPLPVLNCIRRTMAYFRRANRPHNIARVKSSLSR